MSNRRDFTKKDPEFTGVEGAIVPGGSSAERNVSPIEGTVRYNTDLGLAEFYTSTGWAAVAPPPAVNSISGIINEDADSTITILGSGFDAGAVVSITGAAVGGIERPLVTTFSNSAELTAQTNASSVNFVGNANFDVKVTNTTGLSATLSPAGTVDRDPVWSTGSGSRGTFGDREGPISVTHTASDPDGTPVSYSVVSGSLPAGTSLNASNGTISGDPSDVGGTTTSSYTLRATSNGFAEDRSFSITIEQNLDGSSSGRAFNELSDLANLYSTDQTNLWWTFKGGLSARQIGANGRIDFSDPADPKLETTANTTRGSTTFGGINGECIGYNGERNTCSQGTGTSYNWYNHMRACILAGFRLCTRTEILNDVARGTGCSHDSRAIWTSTPGGAGYYMVQGNATGIVEVTRDPNDPGNLSGFDIAEVGIRCCTPTSGSVTWTV